MTPTSLAAFLIAAALLAITPGVDTALVLRTSVGEGPRRALLASAGIALGCVCWGQIVAAGLGALLAASELAYTALRWAGAAYLFYLGLRLIASPRRALDAGPRAAPLAGRTSGAAWLARGWLTNMLNPKVGVFYVSFLPQFIAPDASVPGWTVALAAIHAGVGFVWLAALVAATRPLAGVLGRRGVVAWLDRLTGGLFVVFGARLALDRG